MKKNTSVLVGKARNEGVYLLEWIAHHKNIGFDEILVITNDLTDGSDSLLRVLHENQIIIWEDVTHKPLVYGSIGKRAYKHAFEHPVVLDSEWVIDLDIDEFLVLKYHDNVNDFVCSYSDADAIIVNWRIFGSNGKMERSRGAKGVIERFKTALPKDSVSKRQIKSFSRVDRLKNLSAHFSGFNSGPVKVFHSNGGLAFECGVEEAFDKAYKNPVVNVDYSVCQINHYSVKSFEEFIFRTFRGDAFLQGDSVRYNFSYFLKNNRHEEDDLSISDFSAIVRGCVNSWVDGLFLREKIENVENYYFNTVGGVSYDYPEFRMIESSMRKDFSSFDDDFFLGFLRRDGKDFSSEVSWQYYLTLDQKSAMLFSHKVLARDLGKKWFKKLLLGHASVHC